MQRFITGFFGAMAVSAAFAASAQADEVYPQKSDKTEATTFATGAQEWKDAGSSCGLLGLIPVACTVTDGYDGTDGNPSGSLSTKYTSPANVAGLLTGTGRLQSPSFTLPSSDQANGAVFTVDHKLKADGGITGVAPINGILPVAATSAYTITLVDENDASRNVQLDRQSLTAQNAGFDRTGTTIPASSLHAGDSYHVLIETTQSAGLVQAAVVNVTTLFDNVRLQVNNGTDTLTGKAGATTLPATDVAHQSDIHKNTAKLHGAIDTKRAFPASYAFDYGPASANLGQHTAAVADTEQEGPMEKVQTVSDLDTCKTYYFRATAQNPNNMGTPTLGDILSFQTNCQPDVQTLVATQVSATGASLNSSINPRGEDTTYHYDLGFTNGYGVTTAERTLSSKTATSIPNGEPISGLLPNTTYHYRVVATNALGQSVGNDQTFATPAQSGPGSTGATGTNGANGTPGKTTVVASNQTLSNGDSRALLRIRSKLAKVGLKGARKAQIRLPIACSAKAIRTCAGTVKIRTRSKINPSSLGKKKAKRKVTLATFDYQLARGKSGYAIGRSTPEKLRLMRKLKKVAVDISVQVSDAGGTTRQTIVEKGTYRAQKTV